VITCSEHVFVFSDVWKRHLINGHGAKETNISVFSHGIDEEKFRKIDKKIAKIKIGLELEIDFIHSYLMDTIDKYIITSNKNIIKENIKLELISERSKKFGFR
jgi:hypothetical protein